MTSQILSKNKFINLIIILSNKFDKNIDYSLYLRITSVLQYKKNNSVKIKYLTIQELNFSTLKEADIVLFYRQIFFEKYLKPLLELLILMNKSIIYDLDDYLLNIPYYAKSFNYYKNKEKNFINNILLADLVTVSTENLKNEINKITNKVTIIPNTISFEIIQPKRNINNNTDTIKILLSSSDNLKIQFFENNFIEVLKSIKKKYRNKIELYAVGLFKSQKFLNVFDYVYPMMNYNEYFNFLKNTNFDIGLVPLGGLEDSDSILMHSCKSNIKFLEFSKYGICGIYSNVPPYHCVTDHKDGILVDNDFHSWFNALDELIVNKNLRELIINNSYNKTLMNYEKNKSYKLLYSNITRLTLSKKYPENFICYYNKFFTIKCFFSIRILLSKFKFLFKTIKKRDWNAITRIVKKRLKRNEVNVIYNSN